VLIWVLDDTGFAQTTPYGAAGIRTPTMQRLADRGLKFTNFHTTALCSPSRAAILTGRNHHSIGFGSHMLTGMGFPGYAGRVPKAGLHNLNVVYP
jgi:arylsulfatase A-like enzyme